MFATGASVVSGFATLRLLSRHVSKEDYAVVGVAVNMMNYLPLLDGGFRMVINRRLLSGKGLDDGDTATRRTELIHFSQSLQSWVGLLALGVGTALMMLYSQTPNARDAHQPWTFYLALAGAGAAGMLAQMQATLLTGLGRQAQVFGLNGASSLANLAMLALFFRQDLGVWAFPAALGTVATLQFLAAGLLARTVEPELPWIEFRSDRAFRNHLASLRSEAVAAFRSQTSILLLFSLDTVLIGFVPRSLRADNGVYLVLARVFGIVRNCLQAASEAMWPLVASGHDGARRFEQPLLRLNAWICGAALGACIPTLPPFLKWLMKEEWRPSTALVILFAARFCITTFSSPSAFFLLGRGEFKTLARFVERELILAVLLSIPLGLKFGSSGIALAFLISTLAGTLTPILSRYATLTHQPALRLFATVWWRGTVAASIAIGTAQILTPLIPPGITAIGIGGVAALAGIMPGVVLAWLRSPEKSGLSRPVLVNMLRNF
jgi:O-antigen/teichoic acid export membrane protein